MLAAAGTLGAGAGALSVSLGSAGKLDRDLALEDSLAVELSNGALGLGGSGEGDEGVADRAGCARVGGDGDGLAGWGVSFVGRMAATSRDGRGPLTQGSP